MGKLKKIMTYENFVVPNRHWDYVLEQKHITYVNEFYKKNKYYPSKEDIQNVLLTDDEKEKYKRLFYARYCATGTIPSEPNIPSVPIIPPTGGSEDNSEQESPDTPMIDDSDYVICTYNIATSGTTQLYRYRTDREIYIEKIIYDGKEIAPFSANTSSLGGNPYYACYDFGKLGDVTVKYKLKKGATSMNYVWFGNTMMTEIVIPSCITILQDDYEYGGSIFNFSDNTKAKFNKITSLNPIAPLLGKKIVASFYNYGSGNYKGGTLYVPKGYSMNYSSWMGDGKTETGLLAYYGWLIKEIE